MPRRLIVSIACFTFLSLFTSHVRAEEPPPAEEIAPKAASRPKYDVLVLKGQTLEGVIVSESDDHVTIRVTVAGINADMDYPRSAVQEIRLGAGAPIPPAPPPPPPTSPPPPHYFTIAPPDAAITGGVYWITLTGKLGEAISETPLRDAFRDAKQHQPDAIVIEVNNTPWSTIPAEEMAPELEKLVNEIDELFRMERLLRIPLEEVPEEWDVPPRIVYWVKNALGGVCFMPLTSKEIYFAPEGKLVGMEEEFILANKQRVRPKGTSLRLGHAVGWVHRSGYPHAELLTRGLLRRNIGLSVRIEEGKPVLYEGPATSPDETPLTKQVPRGELNDVLTLSAHTAQLIGISKGTAATREELLALLELPGAHIIDDRADLIMTQWAQGVENAHAHLARLVTEYEAIKIEGDYAQRRAARASQIAKLEQIKGIAQRWNEGLDPFRVHEAGLPTYGDGINIPRIQQAIDKLRLLQSLDRRE